MTAKAHILIVEDDLEIRTLLRDYLGKKGFRVDVATGGAALDRHLSTYGEPDLIVLDVMMPGEDGLSICRRLRAFSRMPILILTARAEDIDRIVGLEMGADDYLAKPFNPRELEARIRAILRRNEPAPVAMKRMQLGGLTIDLGARAVTTANAGTLGLTSAEFDLLAVFVTHPGRVLSRDQLMNWTRGRRADAFDRTIDVQISRLRKKIEVEVGEHSIKTIRGQGYILVAPIKEI